MDNNVAEGLRTPKSESVITLRFLMFIQSRPMQSIQDLAMKAKNELYALSRETSAGVNCDEVDGFLLFSVFSVLFSLSTLRCGKVWTCLCCLSESW